MSPLVSLGIPAYRRPRELRAAIRSVIQQDFDDFELLVGDDSGDLAAVVEAFADPRIRYIANRPRLGMASNWNALLDRAEGDFIGLLMDDDRLLPGYFEHMVSAFGRCDIGVAFSNVVFDVRGRLRPRLCPLKSGLYEDFAELYLRHLPIAVSGALMRAKVWRNVRPLPDLLTADVVLHLRVAQAGWAFVYVDEPLIVYRFHEGQQSKQERRFRDDGVSAWEQFAFDNAEAENLRRRRLGRALSARAATNLKEGCCSQARVDLLAAIENDPDLATYRWRALMALVDHPLAARVSFAVWRVLSRFRRLWSDRSRAPIRTATLTDK